MTQRDERHRQPDLRDSQLAIPFPSRRLLDPQRRVEVVALLARLLLQLATIRVAGREGDDDTP